MVASPLARGREGGAAAEPCLRGGGEMGAMMRATDWAKTPLGPIEHWPQSLKTMIGVVLNNRFPMLIWWGRDLLHLYNDAFVPIMRDKHPASLAAPGRQVWAEIWDVVGPMAKSVQDGGPAVWHQDQQLFLRSDELLEETFFTYSYSPVPGDDGGVEAILCTVQETTEKVQVERQIRMVHELSERTALARTEPEACRLVAEVLGDCASDLPFTMIYTADEHSRVAKLAASSGWAGYDGAALPQQLSLDDASDTGWPLAELARRGREILVEDLQARFGALPVTAHGVAPTRAMLFPLGAPFGASLAASISASLAAPSGSAAPSGAAAPLPTGAPPRAFLILGMSPHRKRNERYLVTLRAFASQVTTSLATTRAYQAESSRAESLAELDRAKTQFFSNVSHELRTPLTLIMGPVEDALSSPSQTLSGHPLEMVRRNAQRLVKLVSSLLDFARIESSRMRAAFEPSDLGALTADLASSFRSAVTRAGLTFEVDCPPSREPVYVDRDLWEKIVLNLLSNALKFTFEGSIRIATRDFVERVELEVSDTGTGIPPRELPRLFERFHRVYGARSRSYEGSGIGLALTRDLVRLHGGVISVQSRVGEGTTFTVSLPRGSEHLPKDCLVGESQGPRTAKDHTPFLEEALRWSRPGDRGRGDPDRTSAELPAAATTAATTATSLPPQPPAAETLAAAPARRARILVVDDNADLRDYLVSLLQSSYDVETAVDGFEAVEAIARRKPTLILADLMMPRLDGFGLIRAVRADRAWRSIPVILLSARAGEESTLEAFEAHADDFLGKPFSARELLARVRAHVELALQREVLERFFTLSLDLMCIAGTDGYFKRVSPGFERLGYSQDELLSRPLLDFLHPDDVAPTLAEIARQRAGQPNLAFENRYRCRDGGYRWISWSVAPDEQGTMYAVGRDVTEDKRISAELRESQKAAQVANRELEAFSYSVAHDLRAPLRSIDGFSMALLEDYTEVLDDEGKQYLRYVRESAQRMALLIDDLLALSRVSRSELRVEPMDLSAIVRAVLARLAQLHPERQVEVVVQDGLLDRGDDRLLAVALDNLLNNAWKFTAKTEGARIEFGATVQDGQRVYFVRDNGAGFDMAFAHKLFGVFQRLHANTDFEGTGIGLATVQRVIRRHQGRVWAEGQVDAGATFSFTLHEKEGAP